VLAAAIAAGLLLVLYAVPSWFVGDVDSNFTYAEQLKAENDIRTTLLQALAGLALLAGLIVTWRTYVLNREFTRRNFVLSREGQVTERFTQAIDQLGNDKSLDVRLGGIYALERIARDSERDHWAIVEVLTAFVRERARWTEPTCEVGDLADDESRVLQADLQAVLTVLGRRNREHETDQALDLSGADLRHVDLAKAHFERADLRNAHLEGANLVETYLEGANLTKADLRGANLTKAHLDDARLVEAFLEGADTNLTEASLERADLTRAFLEGADLTRAHLKGGETNMTKAHLKDAILLRADLKGTNLQRADLTGANLQGAYLEDANLHGAHLEDAYFQNTHLDRADLSGATGLTDDQLLQASTKGTLP
jgi:uncharacterized protein YjbI with pentapeptide repeats